MEVFEHVDNNIFKSTEETETNELKEKLINSAQDIKHLISQCKINGKILNSMVEDAAIKEIAEAAISNQLSLSIDNEQQILLKNNEYIKWASSQSKGEFDPGYLNKQITTMSIGLSDLMQQIQSDYKPLNSMQICNEYLPFLNGWKKFTDKKKENFELEIEKFQTQCNQMSSDNKLYFLNGEPLLDSIKLREQMQSLFSEKNRKLSYINKLWLDYKKKMVLLKDSKNKAIFEYLYYITFVTSFSTSISLKDYFPLYKHNSINTNEDQRAGNASVSLPQDHIKGILNDELNIITCVPFTSNEDNLFLRVRLFIFNGCLVTIELLDPSVDLLSRHYLSEDGLLKICTEFINHHKYLFNIADLNSKKSDMVVTLLLKSQHTLQVLYIQTPSPDILFNWHVSWSDLCGFGRIKIKNNGTCENSLQSNVIIRRTKAEVIELKPFDPLSTFILESLKLDAMDSTNKIRIILNSKHITIISAIGILLIAKYLQII